MPKQKQVGYIAPPKLVKVTPDMATKWLEGNTHNRKLRQSRVDQYARDMRAGKWQATHQGIAFDEDGKLIDGQHRLWAIIESGCTIEMMVFNGLPRGTQLVIDDHLPRNILDSVALVSGDDNLTHRLAGVLRRMMKGLGPWPKWTKPEVMSQWERNRDTVLSVWALFPGPKMRVTNGPVMAPLCRAWLSPAFREPVANFAEILYTGQASKMYHKTALVLRDQLMGGGLKPEEIYRKTETALDAFIQERALKIIRPCTKELFPLPEERDITKLTPKQRRPKNLAMDCVFSQLSKHGALSIKQIAGSSTRVTYNAIRGAVARLEKERYVECRGAVKVPGQRNKVKIYALTSKAA